MKISVEAIRLSQNEKDLLVRVKRRTGIDSWNILCRWAIILSLRSTETNFKKSSEKRDAVEIRWETFAGDTRDILSAALLLAYRQANLDPETVSLTDFTHFKLSDGIKRLATQIQTGLTDFPFC